MPDPRIWSAVDPYLILHRPIRGDIWVVRIYKDGRQDLRRLVPLQ